MACIYTDAETQTKYGLNVGYYTFLMGATTAAEAKSQQPLASGPVAVPGDWLDQMLALVAPVGGGGPVLSQSYTANVPASSYTITPKT